MEARALAEECKLWSNKAPGPSPGRTTPSKHTGQCLDIDWLRDLEGGGGEGEDFLGGRGEEKGVGLVTGWGERW